VNGEKHKQQPPDAGKPIGPESADEIVTEIGDPKIPGIPESQRDVEIPKRTVHGIFGVLEEDKAPDYDACRERSNCPHHVWGH
jgi:hypothetical protein